MTDNSEPIPFNIIHRESGKYLEAAGKTVRVSPRNDGERDKQIWLFYSIDGGNYLLHPASREALDAGGNRENVYTNPLNQDISNPNQYQIWRLPPPGNFGSIVHKTDGKVLDSDGDKVIIQDHKSGSKNQHWIIQPAEF
ncbi:RICIN domain-containing protein [Nostoc sp. FACHB-280]|uniref:RICIN domain-containing protein n=1 Tax=Nostoc sp. FACHB-280 TaxID=2692839 RepID=UPI00168B1A75|nr:ricin-type beta-trefoil lectin domain protein [Nostoc sp. FACHB-280]MBD2496774.1 ricin-type beta-trefoil lectin domain protein [Nostoc sp. FACHB-280]